MSIFKAKIIWMFLLIIMSIGAFMSVAPRLMNAAKYHPILIENISNATGKTVTIGGVSLDFSPSFELIISDITLADIINNETIPFLAAKKIIIRVPFYSFFSGKLYFDSIELQDSVINLAILPDNQKNWYFINQMSANNQKFTNLKSIILSNSTITNKIAGGSSKVENANLTIAIKNKGSAEISGVIANDVDPLKITVNIDKYQEDESQIVSLGLSSNSITVDYTGKLYNSNGKLTIDGAFKAKVSNPSILTHNLAITLPFLSDIQKDILDQPVDISANLLISNDNISVSNINIASPHTNGTGEIEFSLTNHLNLNVSLKFDALDISKFIDIKEHDLSSFSNKILTNDEQYKKEAPTSYINFDYIDTAIMKLNISAKEIKLPQLELKNYQLDFDINNEVVNQGNLYFEVKNDQYNTKVQLGNMSFKKVENVNILLGDFKNEGDNINETLNLFKLDDYIKINDDNLNYKISSQIIFSPKEISMFDVIGTIGQEGQFSGIIATREEDLTDYVFDLKFNNLKLANFEMPLFKERAHALLTKSNDDNYLSYFRWFRLLPASYHIKFNFDNTSLKNEQIDNLAVLCKLLPGSMFLKGSIKSDFADTNYQLDLTAQEIKPILNIKIDGNNLDLNRFQALIPDLLKDDNAAVQPANVDSYWSDQNLNIFKIQKYTATSKIDLKNLQINTQKLTDFSFSGYTGDDIFYVDNLYFNIFGGQFQTRGNISFFDNTLYQFSFTTSGIGIKDAINNSFPVFNYIDGPISTTGSIITQGENPKTLIANLSSSINFISPGMNVGGIDSDVVVDIALKRQSIDKDKALSSVDSALSSGNTNITDINGSIKATGGIFETNNTSFKTRFSSALLGLSLNLNNLTLSSNIKYLFQPYNVEDPISYVISETGPFNNLDRSVDNSKLVEYIKLQYNIITEEDILQAQKIARAKKKLLKEDGDEKKYLYYKLLEENDTDSIPGNTDPNIPINNGTKDENNKANTAASSPSP